MTNLLMLDSVDPTQFSGLHFDALAGYVAPSSWPDYALECRLYPALAKTHHIEAISPSAFDDAAILDCENGDALPSQVPGWVDRQLARGVWRPGVYANLSTWNSGLLAALAKYGSKIRRWVADWTFSFTFSVDWADAQQYTDRYAGRNIDGSIVKPDFFPSAPQPVAKNDLHYNWYDSTKRLTPFGRVSEVALARQYDALRINAAKNHAELRRLQRQARWLAGRDAFVAKFFHRTKSGTPGWAFDHLGWRRIYLMRRALGQRLI